MLYAVIHFDHPDPDGDKPNPWVIDFLFENKNFSSEGIKVVIDKLAEFEEAAPEIKFYVMEESRVR